MRDLSKYTITRPITRKETLNSGVLWFIASYNGTSDIRSERVLPDWLIASLNMAGIGMYDYTKGPQSRLDTIREGTQ